MKKLVTRQITLKPQDLVVLFKLSLRREASFTYNSLAADLEMSASEIHASLERATMAQLAAKPSGANVTVNRTALVEFVVHGARYAFPPTLGGLTRGIPTASAAPPLRALLLQGDEPPLVWPYPSGSTRGTILQPLYPTVPKVAEKDPIFYETLALFDALRAGAARERKLAVTGLSERLL